MLKQVGCQRDILTRFRLFTSKRNEILKCVFNDTIMYLRIIYQGDH